MESLRITLHFDESRKADVIKQLEALDLGEGGRLDLPNGNGADIDVLAVKWKDKKLSREELMALPEIEQVAYCRARGGVFAVMKENDLGPSDVDIETWNQWQILRDKELEGLSFEEQMKRLFGADYVSG